MNTPEPPPRAVNGHVVGSPAAQLSMSMLSFAPAARTFVCDASTATAGSFCLLAENGAGGLPTLMSVSPWADAVEAGPIAAATTSARPATSPRSRFLMDPPFQLGLSTLYRIAETHDRAERPFQELCRDDN